MPTTSHLRPATSPGLVAALAAMTLLAGSLGNGGALVQAVASRLPSLTTGTSHAATPASPATPATFRRSSDGTLRVTAAGLRAVVRRQGLELTAPAATAPVTVTGAWIGRPGASSALPQATPVASDTTATTARGPVVEWVHSQSGGLEQGWTIARRPAGTGPLSLGLTITGARVRRSSARALVLSSGRAGIDYDHLVVRDAAGATVPSHFAVAGHHARIVIEDAQARYPLVVDPDLSAVATLDPPLDGGGSSFGSAVVTRGRWMVVGEQSARLNPEPTVASGEVVVYHDSTGNGTWTKVRTLTLADTPFTGPAYANTVAFGQAVGLLVEPAGVTVFVRLGSLQTVGVWTFAGDPDAAAPSASPGYLQTISQFGWMAGGGVGDFGAAFDAAGGMFVAGAPQSTSGMPPNTAMCTTTSATNTTPVPINERIGTAEVFQRSGGFGTTYSYVTHLDPANGLQTPVATRDIQQWFGGAVAIDPTTGVIAIGARGDDGVQTPTGAACTATTTNGVTTWSWSGSPATAGTTNFNGAVDVFSPSGASSWALTQRVVPSTSVAQAKFGSSLALTGASDGLLVGAPGETGGGGAAFTGAAYLFDQTAPGTWGQVQRISADDPTTTVNEANLASQQAGTSVAASPDGSRLYVGVPGEIQAATAAQHQGDVLVFGRSGATGAATFLTRLDPQSANNSHGGIAESFGGSVAATSTAVAVGAPAYGEAASTFVGRVGTFAVNGSSYAPLGELAPDEHQYGEQFGYTIAQDGDVMAVAMPGGYHGSGYGIGAVGIYDRTSTGWTLEQMAFPDAGNYTATDNVSSSYGWALALHVYRDSTGKDIGLALAIGNPESSVINPGAVGTASSVTIPNTGNVGLWVRNGGPGSPFGHGELFAGGQEQSAANPGDVSNALPHANFGSAVAFTGDGSLLVGEPFGDDGSQPGRVERFEGTKAGFGTWAHQETITAPGGGVAGDYFGERVAADGAQMVVESAAPDGHAVVSRYLDGNATTNLTPESTFDSVIDGTYGSGLVISGNRIAVSTVINLAATESVAIYRMVGNVAVREALLHSEPGDLGTNHQFGETLDFNHGGSVTDLAVGAPSIFGTSPGQAFVYVAQTKPDGSATWSRAATLVPSDALPNAGNVYGMGFGAQVSNWPNNGGLQVSAPDAPVLAADAGRIYSYDVSGIQTPPGPMAHVGVSVPATMQVGADQLKIAGLPPSLLTQNSTSAGSIAAASLGSLNLSQPPAGTTVSSSPMGSIPMGSIPMGSIPMGSITLSNIPLLGVAGGWGTVLAGSPFANTPLQEITLAEIANLPSFRALPLAALSLAGSPMGSIPMGSIALGDTKLSDLPLNPSSSDPALQQWCSALRSAGADTSALGLDCSNLANPANAAVTVLSIGLRGAPMGSIPMGSIPMGSIPMGSIPMGSIPMGSITLGGTPMGSIPMGSINLAGTPMGSIPMGSIPMGSIPMGSIPMGSITLGGTPMGSIPMGSINLAGTPMGSIPMGSIPTGSVPMGSIPMGSIPMGSIPMGSIPMGSIPMGSIPMGSITLSAIDVAATPMGSIPMGSIPMGSIPMGSIPMGSIPMGSIPMGSIPMGSISIKGTPMGSIPMGSINLAGTPMGSITLTTLTSAQVAALVDCTSIDCTASGVTLADAEAAHAIKSGATLNDASGLLKGMRLVDLLGAGGITLDDLKAAIAGLHLSDLSGWDNVTLREVAAIWPYLTLSAIQGELSGIRLGDIANHFLDLSQAQVQQAIIDSGTTLADLSGWDNVTLGEVAVMAHYLTLGELAPALKGIRLGDLIGQISKPGGGTYSEADLRAALNQALPNATLADITNWDDVTIGELGTYGDTTLAQLFAALTAGAANDITLGDLLLALINPRQFPWQSLDMSQVDAQALDQTPTSTSVHVTYRADAPDGLPRTVQLTVQLPDGSRIDPTSITATWTGQDSEKTPTITGSTATWTFTNVPANADQSVSFGLEAPLVIGPAQVTANALVVEDDATASDTAGTTITESFEPNDTIAQATPLPNDTIMLSHVSHAGDLDVYKFDVTQPGQRVSLSLSNLDADLDLVLYAPRSGTLTATGGRSLTPVDDTGTGAAPAQQGGVVTQQPTAGDDIQAPTDLGTLAVVQASFNRGRTNEQIDTGALTQTGTYYVAVSGYNGATDHQPYALRLKRFDTIATQASCPSRQVTPGTVGTQLPATLPDGTNTLFVVDPSRMAGLYGQSATDTLMGQLSAFDAWTSTHAETGVNAAVITVDADPAVQQAYQTWDASPCVPAGANGVVSQVTRILNGYRTSDPALKNIVIVGGDDALPFARVPDRTTLSNESGYASTFSDASNALYATFATSSLQTDDVYVDRAPYAFGDRTLYVPDATIGRLVESPTEIGGQLTDFENADGKLAVSTGLVTGYDFLTDGAQGVAAAARKTYGSVDTHLISDTWTRQDLTNAIASIKPKLLSINAHFDHFRSLPGAGNTNHDETDLFTAAAVRGALNGDLAGSVVFSMGCHSGLSASDVLLGSSDQRALDFAQAVSSQGGVFVGNTGFGYGDTDTVALTESLMGDFAQRLDGSMSVGDALLYAKNGYFSGLSTFTPYDEKVLQEATFYGLPFYRLDVANPPALPTLPVPSVTPDPVVPGVDSSSSTIVPTYLDQTAANGTTYVAAKDPQTGQDSVTTVQDRPVEPKVDEQFAMPAGETSHDALVTALTSVDDPATDPYVFQPVVDSSSDQQDVGVDTAFPTKPVQVNPALTPSGEGYDVAATTGYFRTTKDDGTGIERTYQSMAVSTFFAGGGDFTAPTFSQVVASAHDNTLSVTAQATDDQGGADGVKRVYLLALVDPRPGVATTWEHVDLVRTAGTDEWTGSVPANGTHIEYILQAVDAGGNVGVTSDKATNFVEVTAGTGATPPPPSPLQLTVSGPHGAAGWFTGTTTVTATGGDGLSYEIVGEQAPTAYTGPITVSGTGIHQVRVTSEDGQTQSVNVPIDTTGPQARLLAPADGQLVSQSTGTTVSFDCIDAGSGPTTCTAKLDGSPVASGTVVTPAAGQHTVVVTAGPDVAGNAPSVPTVSHTFTVVAPPTVGTLGVAKTQDGTPTTLTAPFTGTTGASYTATMVWGDGAQITCGASTPGCTLARNGLGGGTFTVSHTYAASAASTTVKATVTDQFGQSASNTIVVNRPTALAATPALLQVLAGKVILKSGAISATLTTGGMPLAGQTLRFTLPDGTLICTGTTDSTGYVRCPSTLTLTVQMVLAGRYVVTFFGHDLYKGSTTSASLIG